MTDSPSEPGPHLDRRQWVSGTGALVAAPALTAFSGALASPPAEKPAMFDYLFFDFASGPPPYRRPGGVLGPIVRDALKDTRAEIRGLFVPQLGWSTAQAAVLVAWPKGDAGREVWLGQLTALPGLKTVRRDRLAATVRPAPDSLPVAGGIYVHRWFVIDAGVIDEFVALSVEGWADFETRFDARIFGLWMAQRTADDLREGAIRLLLMTRYRDHGVWETSRDPTTAAMKAFARRQALTRVSWAASTLLVGG
jgi:hypothetical protein